MICSETVNGKENNQMKSLIIYSSQTGFTKKYAEWLAESLECEAVDFDKVKTMTDEQFASYDTLIYGGWANAGKIVKADWFLGKASVERTRNRLQIWLFSLSLISKQSPKCPISLICSHDHTSIFKTIIHTIKI